MKHYSYLLLIAMTTYCVKPDSSINYSFENNLSTDVEFLYPKRYTYAVPFSWGTMYDLSSEDTTSTSAWHANFAYMRLLPNSKWHDSSGYDSIEEMSPYDTVRIFVFDGQYYYLPYYEVNPNEIHESEDYLCRYDLTTTDLYGLVDQNGYIRIAFPPSTEMSNVKMYPKYEDLCKLYKE